MPRGGWELGDADFTFESTGRTVTLRPAPNVYAVFAEPEIAPHLEAFIEGQIEDKAVSMRILEEIARSQMARPRIASTGEALPAGQDPEDPDVVPYGALAASEVLELLARWKESAERAARFRGDDGGAAGSGDGADVGGAAKPAARTRRRKP